MGSRQRHRAAPHAAEPLLPKFLEGPGGWKTSQGLGSGSRCRSRARSLLEMLRVGNSGAGGGGFLQSPAASWAMIFRGVFEAKSIMHEPAAGRFQAPVSFQARKWARRAQTPRLGMAGAALVPSPRHNEQAQWKSCRPLAIPKQNPTRPDQVSNEHLCAAAAVAGLASPPFVLLTAFAKKRGFCSTWKRLF